MQITQQKLNELRHGCVDGWTTETETSTQISVANVAPTPISSYLHAHFSHAHRK